MTRDPAPATLVLGSVPPEGPGHPVHSRRAVRAIAHRGDQLLLLASKALGDLKFPGGGVDPGESSRDALSRELDEECGRDLLALGPLVLQVREARPDTGDPAASFVMISDYFAVVVGEQVRPQRLEAYESDLGLAAGWVPVTDAVAANLAATADPGAPPWVARELAVLRWLAENWPPPQAT